ELARAYVLGTPRGPFLLALAREAREHGRVADTAAVVSLFAAAASSPGASFAAHSEAAALLSARRCEAEAARHLEIAYEEALADDASTALDGALRARLAERYTPLVERALARAAANQHGLALVSLAASAARAHDPAVAERAL